MDGIFTRRNIAAAAAVLLWLAHGLQGITDHLPPDPPTPCVIVTSTPVLLTPDQP